MDPNRQCLRNPSPEELRDNATDQEKGLPRPPLEKPIEEGARRIGLVAPPELKLGDMPLVEAIRNRKSRRSFADEPLTLEELSFLLWATQGIRQIHPEGLWALRNVPSGGARHPFETYLNVRRVDDIESGLYRYSALNHQLVAVRGTGDGPTLSEACYGQKSVESAAVTFIWTAVPYRTEWRYGADSFKDILLSCGHICQNLYLACEAIGAGTCAIVAYNQEALDRYVGVDGLDEISLYVAPVGKALG
jgi:SagB-type dehydrogenase family enzyme